jgi:hypothetical protein
VVVDVKEPCLPIEIGFSRRRRVSRFGNQVARTSMHSHELRLFEVISKCLMLGNGLPLEPRGGMSLILLFVKIKRRKLPMQSA